LKDQVVLVTGASKGIGRSIALAFAKQGAKLVISARNLDSLNQTKDEIEKQTEVLALQADLTQRAEAQKVIDRTIEKFGKIDVLINNLGGAIRFGHFWELDEADWEASFRLNLLSMVHITKIAAPFLKQSSRPRIINISSISGIEPGFSNPHYNAMKAATINFTKSLANALSQDRVLVNVICPGPVYSESLEDNIRQTAAKSDRNLEEYREEFLQTEAGKIPLGRLGTGDDVASIALFLASDASSWITGSCFHANGGKMRSMS
jgi:3-oxoacyl-[acyl-carrier protein] reductase